jgi:hypothetical protein
VLVDEDIDNASGVSDDRDSRVYSFSCGIATGRNGDMKSVTLFALEGNLSN